MEVHAIAEGGHADLDEIGSESMSNGDSAPSSSTLVSSSPTPAALPRDGGVVTGAAEEEEDEPPPPPGEQTDRYGFYASDQVHRGATVPEAERQRRVDKEGEREGKWREMRLDWDSLQGSRKLKRRIRKGIPDAFRGEIWKRLGGVAECRRRHPEGLYEMLVSRTDVPDPEVYQSIERDINRTFPRHEMFGRHNRKGQDLLRRCLRAYALHDRELGYCQGMAFIVAMFLSYMPEDDAFFMLVSLLERENGTMRGLYIVGMPRVRVMLRVFQHLTRRKFAQLGRKLESENVLPDMFATEWFVTIYCASFPFDLVTRVWDVFLHEGWKVVYRVGLALVAEHQGAMLRMDFEGLLNHLQHRLRSGIDGNRLIARAHGINLSRALVAKVEADVLEELGLGSLDFPFTPASPEPPAPELALAGADAVAADRALPAGGAGAGHDAEAGGTDGREGRTGVEVGEGQGADA